MDSHGDGLGREVVWGGWGGHGCCPGAVLNPPFIRPAKFNICDMVEFLSSSWSASHITGRGTPGWESNLNCLRNKVQDITSTAQRAEQLVIKEWVCKYPQVHNMGETIIILFIWLKIRLHSTASHWGQTPIYLAGILRVF